MVIEIGGFGNKTKVEAQTKLKKMFLQKCYWMSHLTCLYRLLILVYFKKVYGCVFILDRWAKGFCRSFNPPFAGPTDFCLLILLLDTRPMRVR